MKKLGLIFDSSIELNIEEAKKLDIGLIPIIITINNKDFLSGYNISNVDLENILLHDKNVNHRTAAPGGKEIEAEFDRMLETHEKVVVVSMSKLLSGTNNAIKLIAEQEKYKDKVFVWDSKFCSPWTIFYLDALKNLTEKNTPIKEIFDFLDRQIKYIRGYLCPQDIYWFHKGGRISNRQYIIGSILKIIPTLTIENGNINQVKIDKSRNFRITIDKILKKLHEDIIFVTQNNLKYKFIVLKSSNTERFTKLADAIAEEFKIAKTEIILKWISPEYIAHIGPGGVGAALQVEPEY